eukprot:jgi/Mesen1/3101/ME000184S02175
MMPELTGPRVLVMDWVEGGVGIFDASAHFEQGDRLSELSDLRLVEIGVYCSLSQLLDCGFYHADPHPGNLLRTKDGKLAYLGMVESSNEALGIAPFGLGERGEQAQVLVCRNALIEACVHLVNREFDALADDFVNLGLLPPNQRQKEVAGALTAVFQEAIAGGVRNISFGDLSGNLGKTMFSFSFRIPPYFSLVIRRASLDSAAEAVTAALPFQVAPPPPLAESQDAVHLSNLRKLVSLLNKGPQEVLLPSACPLLLRASHLNEVDYGDEEEVLDVSLSWDDVSRAMARAGDLLRGLPQLAIIAELPFPAQQQALALPLELAGRLASRALARTIRSTLPRTPAPGAPGASISGSTREKVAKPDWDRQILCD